MIVRLVLLTTLLGGVLMSSSDSGPQPPCGGMTSPAYPEIDKPPNTQFWDRSDLGGNWLPPACTGWTTTGFATLVVTAGRFRNSQDGADLLRRVGAISALKGVSYWSTTHKAWQTLIVDAFALTGPPTDHRRADFSTTEIVEGKDFYFQQADNLSGKASFRLHILKASPDRIVFSTENITTMRYLLVTLFHPGDMQSIYFMDRDTKDTWRYYSLTRTGRNSSALTAGHQASSINRSVALFRYWAGIPTDQEPPAVR